MAGDWIKMNKSLPRDPRVVRISSALKADRLRTIGGLLSAWCLADEQTEDGKLDGYTPELLDELVGMNGIARAMASVGWLVIGPDFLEFPRFEEHNGQSAKRRAQDSTRKMSARKADKFPHDERTKSGLEKRREEKSIIETPAKKFQKPTLEEITQYGKTLTPPFLKAESFHSHYEANGWKIGKSPMKDWKAAIRTWQIKDRENQPAAPSPPQKIKFID
jgi:hypothetical protein